ncbi:MAG: DUF2530 domain-containing protein [Candidatus Nanopelagicales bacterium]|jgi:membrane protein DedA with SNARE-associated domain
MSHAGSKSDRTAIPAALVGTMAWIIALVAVTFIIGPQIPDAGVWWWGVCLIGTISGVIGLVFLWWRRTRMLRSELSN